MDKWGVGRQSNKRQWVGHGVFTWGQKLLSYHPRLSACTFLKQLGVVVVAKCHLICTCCPRSVVG